MDKEKNNNINNLINDYGEEIISWSVPEFEKHKRSRAWYIVAILVALTMIVFALVASNFLFAVIIVLTSLIIILHTGREPEMIKFSITDEGIQIGRQFYDYDEIKNFAIVYKPREGVKNLYFEFKSPLRHRLSVPLMDKNPLPIRENLLKYLPEDLERTAPPLSEQLARLFRL